MAVLPAADAALFIRLHIHVDETVRAGRRLNSALKRLYTALDVDKYLPHLLKSSSP